MPNTYFPTLDDIFSPVSVAIAGASPERPFTYAASVITSLKEAGFPAIYPVNPRHREAFGLTCYPSISDIPGKVDHVVVSIPAAGSLELLKDCAGKGVNSVHFFSAGFSESGKTEGVEIEKEMLKIARCGKFRIIGPNSTGLFVPKARYVQARGLPVEPGGVAFLSQSGGHAEEVPRHAGARGVRFSKVISYGNALDIGECELLEYFYQDADTKIIAIYIEGVRQGRRFFDILKEAAAKKPVVIYKGGMTRAGLRAAQGHTASMTSSVRVFKTLCRQVNAIMVEDIQQMVDVLVALNCARPYPEGKGVAVLGTGGGPSVEASDQLEAAGLQFAVLSPEIIEQLRTFLPAAGAIFSNPVDAINLVQPPVIYRTMKALAQSPDINIIMYHMGFHPVTRWGYGLLNSEMFLKPMVESVRKASDDTGKTVLLAMGPASERQGMDEMLSVQQAFVSAGIPVFHSIKGAGLALSLVADWYMRFKECK